MEDNTYMGWADARKGVTDDKRIADAVQRFVRKHNRQPDVVLAHEGEDAGHESVPVETASFVQPGVVYVGPITKH